MLHDPLQSNENRLQAQAICDEIKDKIGDSGPGAWHDTMMLVKRLVDDEMPGIPRSPVIQDILAKHFAFFDSVI